MKGTAGPGGMGVLPVGIMGRTYMPLRCHGSSDPCFVVKRLARAHGSKEPWHRAGEDHGQDAHATKPEQLAKPGETKSVLENVGP